MAKMMIFGGNANPTLTSRIAKHLDIPVGHANIGTFSDGEINIDIIDNVRGHDVFLIQPTSYPCNDNLMELILLGDAMRRSSAARITAVVPYFGYARQDRRVRSARVPISARVVADMMTSVGISRLLTVDLHADQIQGFFYMPVDNVYGTPSMLDDIRTKNYPDPLVVSPDVGGVVRARAIAKRLNNTDLAIIDKRRERANQSEVMNIIGDVSERNCILIDDIVDTAGTLCLAAEALKAQGAATVCAYATHPVLSGAAIDNINSSVLDEIVVTDTIPLTEAATQCARVRQISLSTMLANSIRRINEEESVSSLFVD